MQPKTSPLVTIHRTRVRVEDLKPGDVVLAEGKYAGLLRIRGTPVQGERLNYDFAELKFPLSWYPQGLHVNNQSFLRVTLTGEYNASAE